MPNLAQIDPYQVQHISVLKRPNAQQARELLEKVARQVQPILRRRYAGTFEHAHGIWLACHAYGSPVTNGELDRHEYVETQRDNCMQEMERAAAV